MSSINYPTWVMSYTNEQFDRTTRLANELTQIDRDNGLPDVPKHGYTVQRWKQAEKIVREANYYFSPPKV